MGFDYMKFISDALIGLMTVAIPVAVLMLLAWLMIKYPTFGLVAGVGIVGSVVIFVCAFIGARVRGWWNI